MGDTNDTIHMQNQLSCENEAGVIGFLVCLVMVAIVFIIWLLIDRHRKQQEIYRLTMFSIGFSHDEANHLITPSPPDATVPNNIEARSGSSPKCPARSLMPAIMRYHSRQLSNDLDKNSSPIRQPRAQSVDVLNSGHLAVAAMNNIDDYATIRSLRRDKAKTVCETATAEVTNDKAKKNSPSVSRSKRQARTSSLLKENMAEEEESSKEAETNLAVATPAVLLRDKNIAAAVAEDDSEERRYSLVRMRRYDKSPTASAAAKSPRVSCTLLDEISNETDIKFQANKKRKSERKSDISNRKRDSSGVYEDIEAPAHLRMKTSITSEDLTEISDLSSSDYEEEEGKEEAGEVGEETNDGHDMHSASGIVPEVVVTAPESDTISTQISPSKNSENEWLGFEPDDAFLI